MYQSKPNDVENLILWGEALSHKAVISSAVTAEAERLLEVAISKFKAAEQFSGNSAKLYLAWGFSIHRSLGWRSKSQDGDVWGTVCECVSKLQKAASVVSASVKEAVGDDEVGILKGMNISEVHTSLSEWALSLSLMSFFENLYSGYTNDTPTADIDSSQEKVFQPTFKNEKEEVSGRFPSYSESNASDLCAAAISRLEFVSRSLEGEKQIPQGAKNGLILYHGLVARQALKEYEASKDYGGDPHNAQAALLESLNGLRTIAQSLVKENTFILGGDNLSSSLQSDATTEVSQDWSLFASDKLTSIADTSVVSASQIYQICFVSGWVLFELARLSISMEHNESDPETLFSASHRAFERAEGLRERCVRNEGVVCRMAAALRHHLKQHPANEMGDFLFEQCETNSFLLFDLFDSQLALNRCCAVYSEFSEKPLVRSTLQSTRNTLHFQFCQRLVKQSFRAVLRLEYGNTSSPMFRNDDSKMKRYQWTLFVRDVDDDILAGSDGPSRNNNELFKAIKEKRADILKLEKPPNPNEKGSSGDIIDVESLLKDGEVIHLKDVVDKVVVTMHPSFRDPYVEIRNYPYMFSRSGWGAFPVMITIYFKQPYDQNNLTLNHDLNLDTQTDGRRHTIDLELH